MLNLSAIRLYLNSTYLTRFNSTRLKHRFATLSKQLMLIHKLKHMLRYKASFNNIATKKKFNFFHRLFSRFILFILPNGLYNVGNIRNPRRKLAIRRFSIEQTKKKPIVRMRNKAPLIKKNVTSINHSIEDINATSKISKKPMNKSAFRKFRKNSVIRHLRSIRKYKGSSFKKHWHRNIIKYKHLRNFIKCTNVRRIMQCKNSVRQTNNRHYTVKRKSYLKYKNKRVQTKKFRNVTNLYKPYTMVNVPLLLSTHPESTFLLRHLVDFKGDISLEKYTKLSNELTNIITPSKRIISKKCSKYLSISRILNTCARNTLLHIIDIVPDNIGAVSTVHCSDDIYDDMIEILLYGELQNRINNSISLYLNNFYTSSNVCDMWNALYYITQYKYHFISSVMHNMSSNNKRHVNVAVSSKIVLNLINKYHNVNRIQKAHFIHHSALSSVTSVNFNSLMPNYRYNRHILKERLSVVKVYIHVKIKRTNMFITVVRNKRVIFSMWSGILKLKKRFKLQKDAAYKISGKLYRKLRHIVDVPERMRVWLVLNGLSKFNKFFVTTYLNTALSPLLRMKYNVLSGIRKIYLSSKTHLMKRLNLLKHKKNEIDRLYDIQRLFIVSAKREYAIIRVLRMYISINKNIVHIIQSLQLDPCMHDVFGRIIGHIISLIRIFLRQGKYTIPVGEIIKRNRQHYLTIDDLFLIEQTREHLAKLAAIPRDKLDIDNISEAYAFILYLCSEKICVSQIEENEQYLYWKGVLCFILITLLLSISSIEKALYIHIKQLRIYSSVKGMNIAAMRSTFNAPDVLLSRSLLHKYLDNALFLKKMKKINKGKKFKYIKSKTNKRYNNIILNPRQRRTNGIPIEVIFRPSNADLECPVRYSYGERILSDEFMENLFVRPIINSASSFTDFVLTRLADTVGQDVVNADRAQLEELLTLTFSHFFDVEIDSYSKWSELICPVSDDVRMHLEELEDIKIPYTEPEPMPNTDDEWLAEYFDEKDYVFDHQYISERWVINEAKAEAFRIKIEKRERKKMVKRFFKEQLVLIPLWNEAYHKIYEGMTYEQVFGKLAQDCTWDLLLKDELEFWLEESKKERANPPQRLDVEMCEEDHLDEYDEPYEYDELEMDEFREFTGFVTYGYY